MQKIGSFVEGMGLFYSAFLTSNSKSIEVLAELQKKFPNEYNQLKQMQSDPSIALEGLDGMDDEEKDQLITIFVRVATLERKMLRLFDSTPDQKIELVKELNDFISKLNTVGKKE